MKLQKKYRLNSLAFIFICVFIPQAQAGLWDDIKNKAKNVTERVVNETVDEVVDSEPDETTVEPTYAPQKPQYDKQLVADTQKQLNRLGYNSGAVDGLYGNGTKRAIKRFQFEQKLAVTGKPSASLLSRMELSTPTQQAVAKHSRPAVSSQSSSQIQAKPEASESKYRSNSTKTPDVVGLRLGMTPEGAITVLKGRNKNYVIEKVMFSERQKSPEKKLMGSYFVDSVSYVKAYLPDNSETISVVFPAHPSESLSQGIDRVVNYNSEGPLKQNVIAAVHGKYGDRESLFWQFNKNFQLLDYDPMSARTYVRTCGAVQLVNSRAGLVSTNGIDTQCKVFIRIDIAATNDVVTRIRTILIDAPKSADNLAKTHQYIAFSKENDKKKRQADAAKQSTPDF